MPYLNLDLDYFDHIKTKRLVGLLGKGSEVVPIRLWCACGKHYSDTGKLADMSAQEIETICAWWGKSGEMVDALVAVGFLEKKGDGYAVHDWFEHAGHLVAFKKRAKTAAKKRWRAYATSMLQASLKHAKTGTVGTAKLSFLEKKGEPEGEKAPSFAPHLAWISDFLQKQSWLNGAKGLDDGEWWSATYEAVNGFDEKILIEEFAKMKKWCIENPSRKPTPRGFRRFIGHWLEGAYERERRRK